MSAVTPQQIVNTARWGSARLSAPQSFEAASGLIPMPASTPPSFQDLIASSAGWCAVLLNLVRSWHRLILPTRWKAYWDLLADHHLLVRARRRCWQDEATLADRTKTNDSAAAAVCCW